MAKAKNDKAKTTVVTDDEHLSAANTWWYNLSNAEQEPFRDKFQSSYAPTNEEIIAAYGETHEDTGVLKPATPEVAKAWWQNLSRDERAALRDKFADPPEDVVAMYDAVHATAGVPEQQHTGEEPPTVQPATPYASGTNPDLMRNDAIPGENTALYEKSPYPEGYKPPPPPEPVVP